MDEPRGFVVPYSGLEESLFVCFNGVTSAIVPPMIFSRKNAGKWVASKNNRVVDTSRSLNALMKKVASRQDKDDIVFDIVPKQSYFAGSCGI